MRQTIARKLFYGIKAPPTKENWCIPKNCNGSYRGYQMFLTGVRAVYQKAKKLYMQKPYQAPNPEVVARVKRRRRSLERQEERRQRKLNLN